MLRSARDFRGQTVSALDGEIGRIADVLFDDEAWMVRHLVVDTGVLFGRKVLIAPVAVRRADGAARRFEIDLTREAVKNSPSIDTDQPVSRRMERMMFDHYRWPYYWGVPAAAPTLPPDAAAPPIEPEAGDSHLRTAHEVEGYDIEARDGGIGHLEDFIIDDQTWTIRYVVVDTSNWWFGRKVLVDPEWIDAIEWSPRRIHVDLPRQVIKEGPPWDPEQPINREYEARLYDYYGRPAYWGTERERGTGASHRFI